MHFKRSMGGEIPGNEVSRRDIAALLWLTETDEEITRGLAKPYARRVTKPRPSSSSYEETRLVVVLAKDPGKCEGLKEALGVSGSGYTQRRSGPRRSKTDPVDVEPLVQTEVPDVREVTSVSSTCPPGSPKSLPVLEDESVDLPPNATISMGKDSTPPPLPPLYIASTFKGNGPQTTMLHAGGVWEILITPCRV